MNESGECLDLVRAKTMQAYSFASLLFLYACSTIVIGDEIFESPVPDAEVARAQFTTRISDREPMDKVVSLENSATNIYYFTELRNLQGRSVSHRWEYDGQVISEVSFSIDGPRWRVFSKKALNPAMTGKWTVFVIDQSGWPIHASIFEYKAANF